MAHRATYGAVLAGALALVAGCAVSPNHASSPVSPTQPAGIDYFVGDWTSPFTTSMSVNGTPTGCSRFDYTISKIDGNSANVTYDLLCAGYDVKGTGTGVLQGSVLKWSASGTVAQGNASCQFAFTDNTAAPQDNGQILVTYNATVCGIGPFSGSRLLQRK